MSASKPKLLKKIRTSTSKKRSVDTSHALEHFKSALYTWTLDDDCIKWSSNAKDILSFQKTSLPMTGRHYAAITEPGCGMGRAEAIAADAVISHPRGMPYHLHYALRLNDDTIVMVIDSGRWFADHNGHPSVAHGSLTVTGLADPGLLPAQTKARSEFLSIMTRNCRTRGGLKNISVLAFAIDCDFGNGTGIYHSIHDHPHGLEILDEVITRIQSSIRRNDSFFLQSDGTIALALMSCSSYDLELAACHLQGKIAAEPIATKDGDIRLTLRIGGACAPDHATTSLQLLNHAVEALQNTKTGSAEIKIFDGLARTYAEMDKALGTFLGTAELLSESSLHNNLVLARRPLHDAYSRLPALHLVGAGHRNRNCQVDWAEHLHHAADIANLSARLDQHLMELACSELADDTDKRFILPVSAQTLAEKDWPVHLANYLGSHSGIASRLLIGISETLVADDLALMKRRIDSIKALGIGVALLDFGNGLTSPELLERLAVDMVLLDGALIQNIASATDNRFYVRNLMDMAQGKDTAVAATWIEDERTVTLLSDWGVQYLEGRIKTNTPAMEEQERRIA
ncbi:EAL domain-containing protein [Microvirga sp. W0021]|uniref:EAL domain-containing protein n=1 Tax=Hohaiivirga grylli TaxID=3133970 RepID=A0ABV0BNF1_9HYPH